MKIVERIVDGLIRQVVSTDDSQVWLCPRKRQLQEKYLEVKKRLYMAFMDLEKAFDHVPQKVIWWALRKLGVEEWIVRLVQRMYANSRSQVHVGEGFSKEFEVKVWIHQGSGLSPLLFIIVLEALSYEFLAGVPWEDLYADDFVIIADSLEECVRRLLIWKEGIEGKCRKDKGYDLWYRPGPLVEFRRISMRCLSYRSRQQQHQLQWLQTLGASEMQQATSKSK